MYPFFQEKRAIREAIGISLMIRFEETYVQYEIFIIRLSISRQIV